VKVAKNVPGKIIVPSATSAFSKNRKQKAAQAAKGPGGLLHSSGSS
jgi:hypothetical protein